MAQPVMKARTAAVVMQFGNIQFVLGHLSAWRLHAQACSGASRPSCSNRSLLRRETKDDLLFGASRKPTWCLDLRIIASSAQKRIATLLFRRNGTL
jgi:hypothetical protein